MEAVLENKSEKVAPFSELLGRGNRNVSHSSGMVVGGVSSESPNFSDFRDPRVVEHCS